MTELARRDFRFPALDGARAVAVAAVVVFHVGADLAPGGFIGVDVFFVLSGFLITGLLIQEKERVGRVSLRAFYARRALRLFPALVVAVVLAAVLTVTVMDTSRDIGWSSLMALGYVSNFFVPEVGHFGLLGHTWSLAVEEQFYIVWPLTLLLIIRLVGRANAGRTIAVIVLGLASLTGCLLPVQGRHTLYFMPWTHFTELLVGALVAWLWTENKLRIAGWWAWPALAVLTVAVFKVPNVDWEPLSLGGWLVLAIATGVVVAVLVSDERHPVTRLLATAPFRWVGRRSYGIYLYSVPFTIAVEHHDFGRVSINGAVIIVCTLTLAAVSYRFVELPFLRVKRRYETDRGASPARRAGSALRG